MTTLIPELTKSRSDLLLNPQWAEITSIVPEADGISTYWLRNDRSDLCPLRIE